mgnify:CR=1 FL=1
MGERGDKLREAAELADQEEALQEQRKRITDELKRSWLSEQPIASHTDIEKKFAEEYRLTLSDAQRHLSTDLKKYEIEGRDVPALIKELKDYRRTLKGEEKIAVTKSISNLINSYSDHLDKSIEKIYWLKKYKEVLKDMTYNEEKIIKLSMVKDEDTRRKIIDSLCKYWEDKLERNGMPFNAEYAKLSKGMSSHKREFRNILNK